MTIAAAAPANAQDGDGDDPAPRGRALYPPGAVVQPLTENAGADLRRYMTQIARDPRNLDALLGAGREALRMGDPQAALGFYTRAGEVAPRDGRVKAGMGSVMVLAEQPREALDFFGQAVSLGADQGEIAADRGLAYDMIGDPARAQQDYRTALAAHDSPEVRRRLALSLAISGQRAAALQAIDAQLRQNDRAAWRTQAFVLALTGDAAGAEDTARRVMPPGTAGQMAPFLARLAGLTPSQKAMAVHFGEFPSNGSAMASAAPARPPAGPPTQVASASPGTARRGPVAQPATPYTLYEQPAGRTLTDVLRGRAAAAGPAAPAPSATSPGAATAERPLRRFEPAPSAASPGFSLTPGATPAARPAPGDFAEVAAAVDALPPEVELNPAPPAGAARASSPPPAPARSAPPTQSRTAERAAPRRPAAPANPSRHWVQIATADRAGLAAEFTRLRGRVPQLAGQDAYAAPMRSSSRLLVGPFDSAAEAQAFVRRLDGRISAFAWTSPAGQAVEPIGGGSARSTRGAADARARDDRPAARTGRAAGTSTSSPATRGTRGRASGEEARSTSTSTTRRGAASSSRTTRAGGSRATEERPAARSSRSTADRGSTARSRRSTRAGDDDDDRTTARRSGGRSSANARTSSSRGRTRH